MKQEDKKLHIIKPFFFSSVSNNIKPPYVYGFFLMLLFFVSVIIFIIMAFKKYDASILAVFAGVIGTLAGLYFGTLKLYNKKQENKNNGRTEIPRESENVSGDRTGFFESKICY